MSVHGGESDSLILKSLRLTPTESSLDQVNKALGTSLSQEEYASRLRIVRETEDLVREPGANGGEGEIGQRYAQVRRE
jgi:hypothetical protein